MRILHSVCVLRSMCTAEYVYLPSIHLHSTSPQTSLHILYFKVWAACSVKIVYFRTRHTAASTLVLAELRHGRLRVLLSRNRPPHKSRFLV